MSDKISGIQMAIINAGGQSALARALSAAGIERIAQRTVSDWAKKGYVPTRCVRAVSEITGIPLGDLLRKTPCRNSKNG